MLSSLFFTATTLAVVASADLLYVSSYVGNISTIKLENSTNGYNLAKIDSTNACAPNASYLNFDRKNNNLFCLDENIVGTNGSLVSFKVDPEKGHLTKVDNATTLGAPVHSSIYTAKDGTQLLAVAHYAWGLSTFKVDPKTAKLTFSQAFNFTQEKPGAAGQRQALPHPHQVVLDPMRKYFVVPDLGSDLIRVYYIDPKTLTITAKPTIPMEPGSGPRHGRFHIKKTNSTAKPYDFKFLLVTELANTLTSFDVTYLPSDGGLGFKKLTTLKTYPATKAAEEAYQFNAASEIAIRGDSIIVSNRNDSAIQIANPDPKNTTDLAFASDTMATFNLDPSGSGNLTFVEATAAGGLFPRHFSVNKAGTLVAIGLQNSESLAIVERNVTSGQLGKTVVAWMGGLGAVTSVVWGC